MAATYSAFMTTRFYSPVFNTALFDGPFRIYFSQSYESAALKMYHLLQTENEALWQTLKQWSLETKEHIFLLMYPEQKDVEMIFDHTTNSEVKNNLVQIEEWDEGIALGLAQPANDSTVQTQIKQIEQLLQLWMKKQKSYEFTL